jgi:hypothetical protein
MYPPKSSVIKAAGSEIMLKSAVSDEDGIKDIIKLISSSDRTMERSERTTFNRGSVENTVGIADNSGSGQATVVASCEGIERTKDPVGTRTRQLEYGTAAVSAAPLGSACSEQKAPPRTAGAAHGRPALDFALHLPIAVVCRFRGMGDTPSPADLLTSFSQESQKHTSSSKLSETDRGAIAAWRTRPWLVCKWEYRDRRLSRERENSGMQRVLYHVR